MLICRFLVPREREMGMAITSQTLRNKEEADIYNTYIIYRETDTKGQIEKVRDILLT